MYHVIHTHKSGNGKTNRCQGRDCTKVTLPVYEDGVSGFKSRWGFSSMKIKQDLAESAADKSYVCPLITISPETGVGFFRLSNPDKGLSPSLQAQVRHFPDLGIVPSFFPSPRVPPSEGKPPGFGSGLFLRMARRSFIV